MNDELIRLLEEAKAKVVAMTDAEREEMRRLQCESYVRAEMGWPRAKYKWVAGAKVYDSYEDYVND